MEKKYLFFDIDGTLVNKKAIKEIKQQHQGQRYDPENDIWVDAQKPYIKASESLEDYQAKQIKKRLSKIGGKK